VKFKVTLSIGYATANQKDELEIPDEELEGLSEQERNNVINEWAQEWANNYIEIDWKEAAK
jgi:hypothetical protein